MDVDRTGLDWIGLDWIVAFGREWGLGELGTKASWMDSKRKRKRVRDVCVAKKAQDETLYCAYGCCFLFNFENSEMPYGVGVG
jgi:uncharacterized protein YutD